MERLKTFEFAELNEILATEQNLFKAVEVLVRKYGWTQKDMDKWKVRDYDPEIDGERENTSDIDIDLESE